MKIKITYVSHGRSCRQSSTPQRKFLKSVIEMSQHSVVFTVDHEMVNALHIQGHVYHALIFRVEPVEFSISARGLSACF